MGYGLTFDDVKEIRRPVPVATSWGSLLEVCRRPEYALDRMCVQAGGHQPLRYFLRREGTVYVEEGAVDLRLIDSAGAGHLVRLDRGSTFAIPAGMPHACSGLRDACVYFFSSNPGDEPHHVETQAEADSRRPAAPDAAFLPGATTDFRDKYWGTIETVVSRAYCGKRIAMRQGTQNSLEVHCRKHETYLVHAGRVKVGVRVGRGENRSVTLEEGDVFDIPPGLMHMKMSLSDCVVIEVSTADDDGDSYLVEDGQTYVHGEG